uniref:Protein virilizer n=1 Tax=Caenorhabditis tropicalis TaxID=1561998 RepID=A0A1I7V1W3_9PELO
MRRSEYEDVPNRIIPPYIPMDSRHERPSRMPPAPSIRQPLLGDAPMDPYRQAYPPNVTFNGPVVDSYRRRGFDKGPSGEDYGKSEGRQPLLRHPKLAVEHLGGDMDISRSRSPSPEVQIIRVLDSRMVRDDRRRDRGDRSRRSRSRSRSRERRRSRSRTRDRARPVRDGLHSQVRDGIVHTNDNYYEFLSYFIDELNEKSRNSADRDVQGSRKLKETITSATEAEKDRIILPPDFNNSDRERMLHCDTTISGLPSSIFYGSGYGPREHYAKYSAAKDLIDKCHRIGVVNSELHAAIGDWKRMDRTFKSQFSTHISKAANAIILLVKKMASESLPSGFLTMRQLPTDLIDRFKTMLANGYD